jgi:putative PIN family toxin of toxin-antitoxin system
LRLVIDCNVLVAAARGSSTCRLVVTRAIAGHEPVVSAPILSEYREVSLRPKHFAYRSVFAVMLQALETVAVEVDPALGYFGLPDPDDEVYLATALAGDAEALVTGNLRHFPQDSYGTVAILSPRAFVDRSG